MSSLLSNVQEVFSYNSLVHAVSGATGGFTAMTVFYPLDTIRVIMQVDDEAKSKGMIQLVTEILEQQGVKGLYKGWFPVICSLWCSNFVYFYSYNFLKLTFYGQEKPSPWRDIGAASLAGCRLLPAILHTIFLVIQLFDLFSCKNSSYRRCVCWPGVINVLATTPMWVVNTRLKLQGSHSKRSGVTSEIRYSGIMDCFTKIIKNEGTAALWNGTGPSLLLVCNPTIQFVVYEALKRRVFRILRTDKLGSLTLFMIGAVAKAVSTIVTYPMQVIQSRMRAQSRDGQKKIDIRECILHIIRSNGVKGLYKGIEAKLLQTIAMAALMFMTYERISDLVFTLMGLQ